MKEAGLTARSRNIGIDMNTETAGDKPDYSLAESYIKMRGSLPFVL